MTDGQIIIQVALEGLERAQKNLESFAQSVNADIDKMGQTANKVAASLEKMSTTAQKAKTTSQAREEQPAREEATSQAKGGSSGKGGVEEAEKASAALEKAGEVGRASFQALNQTVRGVLELLVAPSWTGMITTMREVGSSTSEAGAAMGGLAGTLGVVGLAAVGTTAALAGTAAVYYELAKKAAEAVTDVENLTKASGMSIQEVKGIEAAFASAGASTEGLGYAFRMLAVRTQTEWHSIQNAIRDAGDQATESQISMAAASRSVSAANREVADSYQDVTKARLSIQEARLSEAGAVQGVQSAELSAQGADRSVKSAELSQELREAQYTQKYGYQGNNDATRRNIARIQREQAQLGLEEAADAVDRAELASQTADRAVPQAKIAAQRATMQREQTERDAIPQAEEGQQEKREGLTTAQIGERRATNANAEQPLHNLPMVMEAIQGRREMDLKNVDQGTLAQAFIGLGGGQEKGTIEAMARWAQTSTADQTTKMSVMPALLGRGAGAAALGALERGPEYFQSYIDDPKNKDIASTMSGKIDDVHRFSAAQATLGRQTEDLTVKTGLSNLNVVTDGLGKLSGVIESGTPKIEAASEHLASGLEKAGEAAAKFTETLMKGVGSRNEPTPGLALNPLKGLPDVGKAWNEGVPGLDLMHPLKGLPWIGGDTAPAAKPELHGELEGSTDGLRKLASAAGGAAQTLSQIMIPGVELGKKPVSAASGGLIKGPGTGTSDSIPMDLSNGEYIVNAESTANWGSSFMDDVNNRRLTKASMGGLMSRLMGSTAVGRFADGGDTDDGPTMKAYEPSLRDKAAAFIYDHTSKSPTARNLVSGLMGSTGLGTTGTGLADLVPGPDKVLTATDVVADLGKGEYRAAAVDAAAFVPMGKVASKVLGRAGKAAEEGVMSHAAEMGKTMLQLKQDLTQKRESKKQSRIDDGISSVRIAQEFPLGSSDFSRGGVVRLAEGGKVDFPPWVQEVLDVLGVKVTNVSAELAAASAMTALPEKAIREEVVAPIKEAVKAALAPTHTPAAAPAPLSPVSHPAQGSVISPRRGAYGFNQTTYDIFQEGVSSPTGGAGLLPQGELQSHVISPKRSQGFNETTRPLYQEGLQQARTEWDRDPTGRKLTAKSRTAYNRDAHSPLGYLESPFARNVYGPASDEIQGGNAGYNGVQGSVIRPRSGQGFNITSGPLYHEDERQAWAEWNRDPATGRRMSDRDRKRYSEDPLSPIGFVGSPNALGGLVRLSEGGIPALVSNGEFRMDKEAVDHYGKGLMGIINGTRRPEFAAGGSPSAAFASQPGAGMGADTGLSSPSLLASQAMMNDQGGGSSLAGQGFTSAEGVMGNPGLVQSSLGGSGLNLSPGDRASVNVGIALRSFGPGQMGSIMQAYSQLAMAGMTRMASDYNMPMSEAQSAMGSLNKGTYSLDLRTNLGDFGAMMDDGMMDSIKSSALMNKLASTGVKPSWVS